MSKPFVAVSVAVVLASCATPPTPVPSPPALAAPASESTATAGATVSDAAAGGAAAAEPAIQIDMMDRGNRMRCEPVLRPGTRIIVAERCYQRGRKGVDEEALAQQLEQVRRDQEELDRRRRETEARRGPGL